MTNNDLEDTERLEKLEELILELKTLAQEGVIVVIEGKKDEASLLCLGIKGDIRKSSQKPLFSFSESLSMSRKKIVLLTDWDRKGGLAAQKIVQYLKAYGITPDTQIRSRFCSLVKKKIKDVESLSNYINKLRYQINDINEP